LVSNEIAEFYLKLVNAAEKDGVSAIEEWVRWKHQSRYLITASSITSWE
jgi:hypothetical protein